MGASEIIPDWGPCYQGILVLGGLRGVPNSRKLTESLGREVLADSSNDATLAVHFVLEYVGNFNLSGSSIIPRNSRRFSFTSLLYWATKYSQAKHCAGRFCI